MASNPEINAGKGIIVAGEDVGGSVYQYVKLVNSTAASATVTGVAADPLIVAAKLIDEAGVAYGVKHVSNKPRVSSMPYLYDIAEGNVSGHSAWERFAYNGDVDSAAPEDIWVSGGSYVFPTAEMGMELTSSSAEDDPDKPGAGTGVHAVTLYYLDDAFTEKSEDISLDGTAVVPTIATDIYRVIALKAKTVGSTGAAVGTITLRHVDNTPIYTTIEPGNTRSRNSAYTVPKSKTLYITSMVGGCGFVSAAATPSNSVMITLRATYDHDAGVAKTFFFPHAEMQIGSGGGCVYRPFEIPIKLPAGTDLKCTATAMADNVRASVGMRGWLE